MKERGIIFTPENHRLIMSGAKVQTRRVIKPQPMTGQIWGDVEESEDYPYEWFQWFNGGEKSPTFTCPHGIPGDKLYVKEGVIVHADGRTLAGYYMDGARITNLGEKRLTAMFMAKRYARTWLEITDVRVERVQDISEEDAKAEGTSKFPVPTFADSTYKQGFERLWNSINRKKHPFESNPWCWCLSFQLIK
jgi:hypothetical protein